MSVGTDAAAPAGSSSRADDPAELRRGTAFGFGAYLSWGAFPLYFRVMLPATAVEILVNRVVWSLVACLLLLGVMALSRKGSSGLAAVWRSPRRLGALSGAACVIALNWGVYIYGVNSGQVVETSLGYFINPLVTVLIGVLLLRERLRAAQWVAVGIGAVAVVVLTVDYGRLPWIALVLACSFGTYGLIKKQVGGDVGALASLTTEAAVLTPVALAVLLWIELTGRGTFTSEGPAHALVLASTGLVTAGPLLLFAAAARRVPLVTIGLLQFVTPVLQLLVGVLVLGEHVPGSRWVGFGLVWLALVVLTADSLRSVRARARLARAAESCAT